MVLVTAGFVLFMLFVLVVAVGLPAIDYLQDEQEEPNDTEHG
jgi:hypothetical protein